LNNIVSNGLPFPIIDDDNRLQTFVNQMIDLVLKAVADNPVRGRDRLYRRRPKFDDALLLGGCGTFQTSAAPLGARIPVS
jgi:hypothetical protein